MGCNIKLNFPFTHKMRAFYRLFYPFHRTACWKVNRLIIFVD